MSSHEGFSADSALSHLVERLHEGVLVFDAQGRCHLVGHRVVELFGVFGGDLVGLEHAEVFGHLAAALPKGGALEGDASAGPRTLELEAGQVLLWTTALLPTGERLELFRDVTEERRAHALAHYIEATTDLDAETGLLNARRFRRELEREHTRAQRSWVPYAVLRLDLDGGPALRERAGEAGLHVALRAIGERVRTARRDYDVVARWEGDELVVLLPTADARAAKTVGKRIVRSLRDGDPVTLPGVPRVTVSIGAAVWSPPSIDTVEDLLHRSASALRAAKTRGACSVDVDADPGGDPKDSAEP
jgi:diguanylate cyclase (GGDEF)-like protein